MDFMENLESWLLILLWCRIRNKGLDLEDLGSHFGINPFSSYLTLETLLL